MNLPLVSIIVNVYNGERFVAECLDSVLALDGGYPLQVIVIDDASTDGTDGTDGTDEILRRYKEPRIEHIRLGTNVGAAAAVNRAFADVRGEFVARIDYDDRYLRLGEKPKRISR